MAKFIDITGMRFGRITVIDLHGVSKHGKKIWNCICDCGTQKKILSGSLLSGRTKSCGCFSVDNSREKATIHGHFYDSEYSVYRGIKKRCYNKKTLCYRLYGGRGITMCDRWLNDFNAFLSDMGRRPGQEYSIDRINNNGIYEPSNCRWATAKTQCNNNSRNHRITMDGFDRTLQEWSEIYGIKRTTIHGRLRRGHDAEYAIKTPVRK